MRKLILPLIPSVFLMVLTFLTSCQKEHLSPPKSKNDIAEKVIAWLDRQKSSSQPNRVATIELLKSNLDFSRLKYEEYFKDNRLIIIPIKDDFKSKKDIDKNSILNLVLIDDESGIIKNGRIAVYTPDAGIIENNIPENTFRRVLNTEPIECSGMFRFLSVTGRWLHQFEYKDGKIKSFGSIEQKTTENGVTGSTSRLTVSCIDWYIVTTYYINGIPVSQTYEYIGTTCGGNGCDDPNLQSLCPEGEGGGGGGSGPGPADIITTHSEISTVEFTDDTDGPGGVAPKIRFQYNALITRTNGIVTAVVAYPTTIANNHEVYIDRYGRNTVRMLTTFGHVQYGTIGAPTTLCTWTCFVYGRWIYTDGSPEYNRTWTNTHMTVR